MLVKRKKIETTEEQVELETPCFFKNNNYNIFYGVDTSGVIVEVHKTLISSCNPGGLFYETHLSDMIQHERITEAEFLAAYTTARINTKFFLEPKLSTNESGTESFVDLPS